MSQTILVTGANRGVGRALVEAAARRGDLVIGVVRRAETATEIARIAGVTIESADVADEASLASLADRLAGRAIDVVIANAGVFRGRGGVDDPEHGSENWRVTLMTNVFGPFATIRALLPNLRAGEAKKVAILASQMASTANASGKAYAYRASKAAVVNLVANMAMDFREEGVSVAALDPGWVRTDMGGDDADIAPQESAAGLLARLDALSPASSGVFENYAGHRWPN